MLTKKEKMNAGLTDIALGDDLAYYAALKAAGYLVEHWADCFRDGADTIDLAAMRGDVDDTITALTRLKDALAEG